MTFRMSEDEFNQLDYHDLLCGLVLTWIVGIGRYWDDPKAEWIQHLGIGSVIYIFILVGLIWLLLKPF